MTIHEQHPRYAEQIELELEMSSLGTERFESRLNKSIEQGRGGDAAPSRSYIRGGINSVVTGITEYVNLAYSGRPGPRSIAAQRLRNMDYDAVAYITLRSVLNDCLQRRSHPYLLRIAAKLGRSIEYEAKFASFQEQAPALYDTVKKSADGGGEDHIAKVLTYAMNKFDIDWKTWGHRDRVQVGMALVDILATSTGLVEIVRGVNSNLTAAAYDQYVVQISPSAEEWFANSIEAHKELSSFRMPTIIPPKPWDDIVGGGYYGGHDVSGPLPIVRQGRGPHHKLLHKAQLGAVYSALNAVQDTAWKINKDVLEVAAHFAGQNSCIAGLPPADDYPLPERPPNIDTDAEVLRQWKWASREVHEKNTNSRMERLTVKTTISLATRFKDEPEIYFPHNLDFRGRVYPLISAFSPQGSDLEKAIIHFAEGKPLGTDGARWLAIHGANLFGVDKVSFDERVQWVQDNHNQIRECAYNPYDNLWWTEADKPWNFLAFCFEWMDYTSNDEEFVSHLPIALDGSCNGLQHFSAMLLDPVGGKAVNLIPSDKPQDIYQSVADEAIRKMNEVEWKKEEEKRWAYAWAKFGIDRKITKRPVMVLPYGGTTRSCLKYVEEAVMSKISAGQEHNFGDELSRAIAFLSRVIWDSIGDVVIAARDAMDWLQKTSRVLSKHNHPIHWTTPSGFIAYQAYPSLVKRNIKTKISGSIVRATIYDEQDEINKTKQATSISPNFVHSMDAAAMVLTIDKLQGLGIRSFAMVHDSYGVHACDATLLSKTLREVFVEVYETEPLNHFRNEIVNRHPELEEDIPPLPKKGTLDLKQVMNSDYFFA